MIEIAAAFRRKIKMNIKNRKYLNHAVESFMLHRNVGSMFRQILSNVWKFEICLVYKI